MSALESSVTLDDVFSVASAKRVPLAPELAGYLTLEVADGARAQSGEVDARTVYISEEGTVALVRPKKDAPAEGAEASVRAILAKLLEASGSATPALSAAARKSPGEGLDALVTELEAALIPVNRAAGRRALARLAREVKRVTLGVGRNASMPARPTRTGLRRESERPPASEAQPAVRARGFSGEEIATARRDNQLKALATEMNSPEMVAHPAPAASPTPRGAPSVGLTPPPRPNVGRSSGAPPRRISSSTAVKVVKVAKPDTFVPPPSRSKLPGPPPAREKEPERRLFGGEEVESLVDAFGVSSLGEEREHARELKAIAGLDPTPPPPDANALAELTRELGKGLPPRSAPPPAAAPESDGVEDLLALADASAPPPVVREAPKPSAFVSSRPPPPNHDLAPPSPLVPDSPHGRGSLADDAVRSDVTSKSASVEPLPREEERKPRIQQVGTYRQPRAPRTGFWMLVLTLLVLGAGGAAIWKFKPSFFTGGVKRKQAVQPTASAAPPPAPKCKVALVVEGAPVNAEVLLRVGQSPLDVERMPVGTRLEFVATAENFAPRRAIVKSETSWDSGPDGRPRIDVPIQLDPSKAKPGAVDPWPAAEPGSQVGGTGAPGTVHVLSNVRGAEVWLLAGLGPEARIEQLRCDADIDVLLAGPPNLRKRLHVGERDIAAAAADADGNKTVTVSAK